MLTKTPILQEIPLLLKKNSEKYNFPEIIRVIELSFEQGDSFFNEIINRKFPQFFKTQRNFSFFAKNVCINRFSVLN